MRTPTLGAGACSTTDDCSLAARNYHFGEEARTSQDFSRAQARADIQRDFIDEHLRLAALESNRCANDFSVGLDRSAEASLFAAIKYLRAAGEALLELRGEWP